MSGTRVLGVSAVVAMSVFALGYAHAQTADENAADFLLMEPNAEVVFVTTGGADVRADWSETAKENFKTNFSEVLTGQGYSFAAYEAAEQPSDDVEQLLLLQELVTQSLTMNIPHKEGKGWNNTDLTLGPTASLLKDEHGANRAVFVDHRSQIESSGVFMMQVAIGAATGYVPPSQNLRFSRVSVYDLDTGELLNTKFHGFGDPRNIDESRNIVTNLTKDFNFDAD